MIDEEVGSQWREGGFYPADTPVASCISSIAGPGAASSLPISGSLAKSRAMIARAERKRREPRKKGAPGRGNGALAEVK